MENFSLHPGSPKLGVCYNHEGVGDQLRRENKFEVGKWGNSCHPLPSFVLLQMLSSEGDGRLPEQVGQLVVTAGCCKPPAEIAHSF